MWYSYIGVISDITIKGTLKLHLSLSLRVSHSCTKDIMLFQIASVRKFSPQPPLTPMTTVSVIFFATCLPRACADTLKCIQKP